jgi:predicted DCC family thiol-disulfide oxidoreductase YuxK
MDKPVLIFDGDCGFCRMWIARWEKQVDGQVLFQPFQEVLDQYPQLSYEKVRQAVHFIECGGKVSVAAEAIVKMLQYAPCKKHWLWLYRYCPGASAVSEWHYKQIARHRDFAAFTVRWLSGRNIDTRSWDVSRDLYLRCLGMIYLIAFSSFWIQIEGLIGERGILPVAPFVEGIQSFALQQGHSSFALAPTLSLFIESDWFLHAQCAGGVLLALSLILGFLPGASTFILWLLYLSITVSGQTFMGFQWENLLLEAGLIAVLMAPWSLKLRSNVQSLTSDRPQHPLWATLEGLRPTVTRLLTWWVLFRLLLQSGLVKLASNDDVWWDLTALSKHYWTQPIPNAIAWYANQLPDGLHKFCVLSVFLIEILCPFLIFGPRNFRRFACFSFIFLMLIISATGNYAYFNLLSLCLCLTLLDDVCWPRRVRAYFSRRSCKPTTAFLKRRFPVAARALCCLLLLFTLVLALLQVQIGSYYVLATANRFLTVADLRLESNWRIPALDRPSALATTSAFRSINSYGLFANMTETRPEIIIEGSRDGIAWLAYEFKYKPGDVNRRPPCVAPHQPRLDWQMWFAALGRWQDNAWMVQLLGRLLEGSEEVENLFAHNPFEQAPPTYIRAKLYNYTFTDYTTSKSSGPWWQREYDGLYFPAISLEDYYKLMGVKL